MIGYQMLLEIDCKTAAGVPVTERFCCAPDYVGGGHTWLPVIVDPGFYHASLFASGRISGASQFAAGEAVLDNSMAAGATGAGQLDYLRGYQIYGSAVRCWIGLANAVFPAGFERAYTAVAEAPQFDNGKVTIALRSRQVELDVPLDTGKFLGNNDLPAGLEGNADLKDQIKPSGIGRVYNVTPKCCNTSKLIFAVSPRTGISAGELNSELHVYDNGVELPCGGIVGDLETSEPSPGQYLVDTTGYIRLGANPAGVITVSFAPIGYALTSTPANLISQTLALAGKSDMLGAINLTDTHERGIWLADATNPAQIIDRLLAPLGYFYYDHDGLMQVGQLSDPATLPTVYTLDGHNIADYTILPTQDTPGGITPKRITLQYAWNNTVQATPAGIVDAERKAWLAEQFRTISHNTGVSHPLSEELTIATAMTHSANDILDILAVLHVDGRQLIEINVTKADFLAARRVLPGQCVLVTLGDRYDIQARHMLLVDHLINYRDETVKMTVWG